MLKPALIAFAVLFVGLLIYADSQPDTFEVKRSITINATAPDVFVHVNDFHQWTAWSPWERMDPLMKRSYSGPESGLGAIYEWEGNSEVGQGRMEIVGISIPDRIRIKLDFIKPIQASNVAEFTFDGIEGHTEVTWTMTGENKPLAKLMQVFVSMDSMVGKDFEAGLANLKAISEK